MWIFATKSYRAKPSPLAEALAEAWALPVHDVEAEACADVVPLPEVDAEVEAVVDPPPA